MVVLYICFLYATRPEIHNFPLIIYEQFYLLTLLYRIKIYANYLNIRFHKYALFVLFVKEILSFTKEQKKKIKKKKQFISIRLCAVWQCVGFCCMWIWCRCLHFASVCLTNLYTFGKVNKRELWKTFSSPARRAVPTASHKGKLKKKKEGYSSLNNHCEAQVINPIQL